jgi:hypothetical protein
MGLGWGLGFGVSDSPSSEEQSSEDDCPALGETLRFRVEGRGLRKRAYGLGFRVERKSL